MERFDEDDDSNVYWDDEDSLNHNVGQGLNKLDQSLIQEVVINQNQFEENQVNQDEDELFDENAINDDAEEENLVDNAVIEENLILNEEESRESFAITKKEPSVKILNLWPDPLLEDWEKLNIDFSSNEYIEEWIYNNKQIIIRTITWNLAANDPPKIEEFREKLLPDNKFHLYFIGSEECERTIAQSAINTSKKKWESFLIEALGPSYKPLRAQTLQAIHLVLFAHVSIAHLCSNILSGAVACGIGNTLGNKGAVAIKLNIGKTSILVINSHLAAHQNAVKQRNNDIHTITKLLPERLSKKSNSDHLDTNITKSEQTDSLVSLADRVIFMGDLNYRIRGNRKVVDQLIAMNMHEVMLHNDQLKWSMSKELVLRDFVEPPLNFRPTYKLDINSDKYDTGTKKRIPAWCDRILYCPRGLECLSYNSEDSIRTSDHRPVYASFKVEIDLMKNDNDTPFNSESNQLIPEFSSKTSTICALM